jgi:hypothetical protein
MIVSLSDDASGDFADANVRPPYKPENESAEYTLPRGVEGLGCI